MVHGSEHLLVEKASDGRESDEHVGLHHLDRVDQTQTLEAGVVHGEAGEVVEQVLHLRQVLPPLGDQPVLVDDVEPLVRLLLGQPVPPDNRVPDRQHHAASSAASSSNHKHLSFFFLPNVVKHETGKTWFLRSAGVSPRTFMAP